jgi:tyrosine-protein kinase Etk/Wzc
MKTFPDSYTGAPAYGGAQMHGYATVPATSDAKAYLKLLLSHKLGLILATLLGLGLAWLYLISTEPVFETSALVEVVERGNILDDDGGAATDWNAPTINEEANRLRSRRVLQPVVDNYDLRTVSAARRVPVLSDLAERIPAIGNSIAGLDAAKGYAWQDTALTIAELDVPRRMEDSALTLTALEGNQYSLAYDGNMLIDSGSIGERMQVEMGNGDTVMITVDALTARPGVEFDVVRQSLEEAINGLRTQLSTETSDSKSRMITVKLAGHDPDRIAELTNAIVTEYQAVRLGSENLATRTELELYEVDLPRVEGELRDAERALSEFRRNSGSFDEGEQTRAKIRQLDKLETQLIDLQIERDELKGRYTDVHPSLRKHDKEIAVIQQAINTIAGTISARPDTQRELSVLEQEVTTKLSLFTEMNENLQRLRVAQAGNVGSVDIYDPALAPRNPISPNAALAIVGAVLSTLFLYLLWLTLRSALTTQINDQESLERASGLPVYMNIPKSAAQKRIASGPAIVDPRRLLPGSSSPEEVARSQVLAIAKPDDYSVENLRGLRSMLEDVMAGADNNILMVTSPLPSMGKSFVSLNLSVLLAQAGRRVLLIDADYQRGQLHKSLGLPVGPGLPEVVRGKSELRETVRATSVQNLFCIPRGFTGDAGIGMEMPSDKEFAAFMQVVAPRFDIAIIDTPPVLSVATAASLGRHAGSTIMVVKEGEVKEPQLNESIKRLMFSGVRVSGCILNGSSTPTPKHYAYYREQLD